jgi:hypothetical protein
MLCFVILFSCGASGYVQTTLLGMYSYIRNKQKGAGRQHLPEVVWPAPKVNKITERSVSETGLSIPHLRLVGAPQQTCRGLFAWQPFYTNILLNNY